MWVGIGIGIGILNRWRRSAAAPSSDGVLDGSVSGNALFMLFMEDF